MINYDIAPVKGNPEKWIVFEVRTGKILQYFNGRLAERNAESSRQKREDKLELSID